MFKEIQRKDRLSLILYLGLILANISFKKVFIRLNLGGIYILELVPFILSFLMSWLLYKFYKDELKKDFKEYGRRKFFNLVFTIVGVVIIHLILKLTRNFIGVDLAGASSGLGPEIDLFSLGLLPYLYMTILSITPIFSAFIEELIFRKILLGKYPNFYGKRLIFLVLSSALFGLIHYFNLGSLKNTIPYMVVGLYFGLIYMLTDNIFYSMGVHLLNNFILSILPMLAIGVLRLVY